MVFWKPSRPKSVEPAVAASAAAPGAPHKPKVAHQPGPPQGLKTALDLRDESGADVVDQRNKGFDPYNSGAFNVKDTWHRVNRKK